MQGASGAVAWSVRDLYTDAMGVLDRLGALPAVGPIGVEPLDRGSLAAGLCHDICRTIACTLAAVTVTASSSPSVSTTMWRFLPLTFLPAS